MTKPDPNDTQVIRPRRVYKCVRENKLLMRSDVWKDHKGDYHCPTCSDRVEEVTDTTTGHDFMEILGV